MRALYVTSQYNQIIRTDYSANWQYQKTHAKSWHLVAIRTLWVLHPSSFTYQSHLQATKIFRCLVGAIRLSLIIAKSPVWNCPLIDSEWTILQSHHLMTDIDLELDPLHVFGHAEPKYGMWISPSPFLLRVSGVSLSFSKLLFII